MTTRLIRDEDIQQYIDIRRQSLLEYPAFVGSLAERDASLTASELASVLVANPLEDFRFGYFRDSQCIGVSRHVLRLVDIHRISDK